MEMTPAVLWPGVMVEPVFARCGKTGAESETAGGNRLWQRLNAHFCPGRVFS